MAKNKEQNVVEEEKLEEQVEDLQTDTDAEEKQVDDTEDLTILKEEVGELKEALQRERAEFANFRKRTIQEKSDIQSYVTGQILGDLLPAFDSFDQLFATREAEGEQSDANKFLEMFFPFEPQDLASMANSIESLVQTSYDLKQLDRMLREQ